MINLSIAEMQSNGQKAAEVAEQWMAHASKLQESYAQAVKGLVETGISNMNFVKDTATAQFEQFANRVEDAQAPKPAVSVN